MLLRVQSGHSALTHYFWPSWFQQYLQMNNHVTSLMYSIGLVSHGIPSFHFFVFLIGKQKIYQSVPNKKGATYVHRCHTISTKVRRKNKKPSGQESHHKDQLVYSEGYQKIPQYTINSLFPKELKGLKKDPIHSQTGKLFLIENCSIKLTMCTKTSIREFICQTLLHLLSKTTIFHPNRRSILPNLDILFLCFLTFCAKIIHSMTQKRGNAT